METECKCGSGSGKILVAALGGAVVGAAVALLLAPKSGRETRKQLVGYVDTAKETLAKVPDALKAASHAAQEAVSEEFETHPAHHGKKA